MKIYLLLLIAFLSIVSYSQEGSIVLHKKNVKKIKEIAENKRIRVVTLDGKKYYGRFTIIDSASIQIEGNVVALNSITKIRRKSLFGTIVNPIVIVFGTVLIITAAVAGSGPYGGIVVAVFLPPGIAMASIAAISSSYKSKNWEYSIKNNNENYHLSSPLIGKETGTEP